MGDWHQVSIQEDTGLEGEGVKERPRQQSSAGCAGGRKQGESGGWVSVLGKVRRKVGGSICCKELAWVVVVQVAC